MHDRIGLFGGSFNPIHVGHLIIARAVLERIGLRCMIFLPSSHPPHKPRFELLAAEHRAEMVRRAIEGEPGFELSNFDLARPGPSYTIETVNHFKALQPNSEIFWLIGADSLAELPTWHRAADLCDACRIVTAQRSDADFIPWGDLAGKLGPERTARLRSDVVPTPRIDIASTEIRGRIRDGKSIRFQVPEAVRAYIETHGLYRA